MTKFLCVFMCLLAVCISACRFAPEKRYALQAEVISLDGLHKLITVKHGDIPGLMPTMTMTYTVADPRQIEKLQPGDTISADLVVSDTKGWLEKIVLIAKSSGQPPPETQQHIPQPGDAVPNFALRNQDGKLLHLHDYAGKILVVTFIYTRCPLPDFCPRMSQNFRAIQDVLRRQPASLDRVAFLSISFDPEHDTPAVLKHYASIYDPPVKGQKAADWQFAVPSQKDLPEIARFFGLVYQPDQAQIIHSLSTTLIGPDDKIQQWYDTNDWKPEDLAQAINNLVAHS